MIPHIFLSNQIVITILIAIAPLCRSQLFLISNLDWLELPGFEILPLEACTTETPLDRPSPDE